MKPIPGYGGRYSISTEGKVWSNLSNKFLKTFIGRSGYKVVTLTGLSKSGCRLKTHMVHRLVADTYIDKVPGKDKVNHKNGVRTDNRVENLEWCTQKENVRHAWATGLAKARRDMDHPNTKLSLKTIREIFSKIDEKYGTLTRLAKRYKVSVSLIHLIKKGYRTA